MSAHKEISDLKNEKNLILTKTNTNKENFNLH